MGNIDKSSWKRVVSGIRKIESIPYRAPYTPQVRVSSSSVVVAKAMPESPATWESLPSWMTSRTHTWKFNLGSATYFGSSAATFTAGDSYVDVYNLSECYITQNSLHKIWQDNGLWWCKPEAAPNMLVGQLHETMRQFETKTIYFGGFTTYTPIVDYYGIIHPAIQLPADNTIAWAQWDNTTKNYVLVNWNGCGVTIP